MVRKLLGQWQNQVQQLEMFKFFKKIIQRWCRPRYSSSPYVTSHLCRKWFPNKLFPKFTNIFICDKSGDTFGKYSYSSTLKLSQIPNLLTSPQLFYVSLFNSLSIIFKITMQSTGMHHLIIYNRPLFTDNHPMWVLGGLQWWKPLTMVPAGNET